MRFLETCNRSIRRGPYAMGAIAAALITTIAGVRAADLPPPPDDDIQEETRLSVFLRGDGIKTGVTLPVFGELNIAARAGRPDRYVPNVTNPLFNETPFITTEIRPIYLFNNLPGDFITGGGEINVIAVQARVALTENLGFIAVRDGYADIDFDGVLPDEYGAVNIVAGLKYALFQNLADRQAFSIGVSYEIPIEDLETAGIELQGAGNGFINFFASAATSLDAYIPLQGIDVQASAGVEIALDGDDDTSLFHFALHADYELIPGRLFPLLELNGFVPIEDGSRLTGALAELNGVDIANFGSSSRDTTITGGGGFRYRFTDHIIWGAAAEAQITNNDDSILDWRVTTDLIFHF